MPGKKRSSMKYSKQSNVHVKHRKSCPQRQLPDSFIPGNTGTEHGNTVTDAPIGLKTPGENPCLTPVKLLFTFLVAVIFVFRASFQDNLHSYLVAHKNISPLATYEKNGGWKRADDKIALPNQNKCTIDKRFADELSLSEFEERYKHKKPVILKFRRGASEWTNPETWSAKNLKKLYGRTKVWVGTGLDIVMEGGSGYLSQTFDEFVEMTLREHTDEPLYLFDRDFHGKAELLASLRLPTLLQANEDFESIFIVGTTSSGVSFHKHADGWNGIVYGKKKWYLYPKETTPPGGDWPSFKQQDWINRIYPLLPDSKEPIECLQEAGEIIYIPEGTYHATINIGDTVGIAAQRKYGESKEMKLFDEVSKTFLEKFPNSLDNIIKRNSLYQKLLVLLPENVEIMVKLAEGLVLKGDLLKAHELMERSISIDPFNARAFIGFARINSELDSHEKSDASFLRAIELNPESPVFYAEYGIYLVERNRMQEAERVYETASKKWPDEEEFLMGLFKVRQHTGQTDAAEAAKRDLEHLRERLHS